MNREGSLEGRIDSISRDIFARIGTAVPPLFRKGWRTGIFEAAASYESFKTGLFRFIDVVPALEDDDLVARLFTEYFGQKKDIPLLIRGGVRRLSSKSTGLPKAAAVIRAAVNSLAGIFIAGEDPNDAVKCGTGMRREGLAVSFDLLGEEVLSSSEERAYVNGYRELMSAVRALVRGWTHIPALDNDSHGPIPKVDVSAKVSSFYSQLDPMDWEGSIEAAGRTALPILSAARDSGVSLTLDMEHYRTKDLTIALFKDLMAKHGDGLFGGIVLQSYLQRARDDLLGLIGWSKETGRRITIRLVKGAYWDLETVVNVRDGWPVPVLMRKEETDRQYEELLGLLLGSTESVRPAIATHNVRSIACGVATAEALGLPKEAFEFQMLYGMADPLARAVRDMGYRVRIYSPLGQPAAGMGYVIRRLLECTFPQSFLRLAFFEKRPPGKLAARQIIPEAEPAQASRADFRNEPAIDFSIAANRDAMRKALREVKEGLNRSYPLLIGGREVRKDRQVMSLNPARPEEVIGRVSSAGVQDADIAVTEARRAWEGWRWTSPKERADVLFTAADVVRQKRYKLMALEVYEAGKTWKEADGDIAEAVDYLEYYGREAMRIGAPGALGDYPGEENEYVYEPKGVGVVISPWNFPLAIPTGMVSAGVVTGNAVIFKPSGLSPVLGWELADVFRSAGLMPGVLQFLPGPGDEVGEHLVSHPGVDFVAFTGSKDIGLRIVRLAGETREGQRNVTRVIAEMGGKNAVIVDETADLDGAISGIVASALSYQGQKCSACSRVIAIGGIYERLCMRLKEAMESVTVGPTDDPRNSHGPLIDGAAVKKVSAYVETGLKTGRALIHGKTEPPGFFIRPSLFVDLPPDSPLCTEEIFGPVLVVLRARDIDEALEIANSVPYALTGGIFSRSPTAIAAAKRCFRAGNLYINRKITGALVGRQPFGGYGMSGVGSKAGGPDYLLQFVNPRSISENTLRRGFAPSRARMAD